MKRALATFTGARDYLTGQKRGEFEHLGEEGVSVGWKAESLVVKGKRHSVHQAQRIWENWVKESRAAFSLIGKVLSKADVREGKLLRTVRADVPVDARHIILSPDVQSSVEGSIGVKVVEVRPVGYITNVDLELSSVLCGID